MADLSSAIWNKPAAAASADDVVTRSLRFNSLASHRLTRTFGTGTSTSVFTYSMWLKLGNRENSSEPNVGMYILDSVPDTGDEADFKITGSAITGGADHIQLAHWDTTLGGFSWYVRTNALFRDYSDWYHFTFCVDTGESGADSVKIWQNGNLLSHATASYPTGNHYWNEAVVHNFGRWEVGTSRYYDGYLADVHFIDGTALTYSSFAKEDTTTGQWKPKAYNTADGAYGNNGFHLDFKDSSDPGKDVSGEGNDFAASGLAASDVMLDTPTNNYCTFNLMNAYSPIEDMLAEGNLRVTTATGASGYQMMSTMGVSSGKWYYEYRDDSPSTRNTGVGWVDSGEIPTGTGDGSISGNGAIFYHDTIYVNGGGASAGETLDNGDICGVALDADAGKIWFSINGTWWDSQDPAAGSNAKYTASTNSDTWVPSFMDGNYGQGTVNYGQDGTFAGVVTAQGNADGNGHGDFYYSPPSGFLALCSKNLPTPTIVKPSEHYSAKTYTGNGTDGRTVAVDTQPDLMWVAALTGSGGNALVNSVDGPDKNLATYSTSEAASATGSYHGGISALDTTGPDYSFTATEGTGDIARTNGSGVAYASWAWKAGTSFEAEDGVSGSGSKNATAGFSIATWEGDDDGGGGGGGGPPPP